MQNGDGGQWQVFVRAQAGGGWWLAADVGDKVTYAAFGPGALYLLSRLDAPNGKVLRLPLRAGATVADAAEAVPEADVAIEGGALASPGLPGNPGISLKPRFDPGWVPWLEQGGVGAIAHIRGGGEYGEAWHHAGRLAAKQNTFDGFAGCARFLIESRLTTSQRLAILGGSSGAC